MNAPQKTIEALQKRLDRRREVRQRKEQQIESIRQGTSYDWQELDDSQRLQQRARSLGLWRESTQIEQDPQAVGQRVFEQIIDQNDLLDVTFLARGDRASKAVGRILLPVPGGTRLGTGFMVSPQVMMTNNHVLASAVEAADATFEFDFFNREAGGTGPVQRFRLEPFRLFLTDVALDFSAIAVEAVNDAGQAVANRGFHRLIAPSGKALVGERLNIIQHPGGDPQKVVVHDNTLVDVFDDFVHYRADTQGGSSGSSVFNNRWDLVALHHAAVGSLNEGVRISRIVDRLREMISQESTVDRDLIASLLANGGPTTPASAGSSVVASATAGASTPAATTTSAEADPVVADGVATWVIPLRVSVELPNIDGAGSGDPLGGDSDSPAAEEDDPLLSGALDQLDDADRREYYNADRDAEARQAYYPDNLQDLQGAALFSTLSSLVESTHRPVSSYRVARYDHLYPWIDRRAAGSRQLQGIYSNLPFDAETLIRQEIAIERQREARILERGMLESTEIDEDFLRRLENSLPYNCEHVVPQSWFNRQKTPKIDLHHLFTCESRCNSFRSNHAFDRFAREAVRDDCGRAEDGRFEPLHGHGAAARATFYFLLRYPGEVADHRDEMPVERLAVLQAWHQASPPSEWELHRNAEIEKAQGNRNPFIDFPELASRAALEMGLQ
ncbi:MAG: endonuclease [Acidobacteriota bacterium]